MSAKSELASAAARRRRAADALWKIAEEYKHDADLTNRLRGWSTDLHALAGALERALEKL